LIEKGNIKNLSELGHSEVPVDLAASWNAIAAGLDARKKRRFWLGWISAASVVLFIGLFAFLFHNKIESNPEREKSLVNSDTHSNELTKPLPSTSKSEESEWIPSEKSASPQSPNNNSEEIKSNFSKTIQHTIELDKEPKDDISPNVKSVLDRWSLNGKTPAFALTQDAWLPDGLIPTQWFTGPIQEDKPKPSKSTIGWEVFAGTSPSLVNKLTQENKDLGWKINRRFNEIVSVAEKTSAGYQFNAGVQMNVGKHFFIQSGFGYSEKQEWVKYNHTLKDFTIVRESEKRLEYAPMSPQQWVDVNFEGNNRYRFAEIPLLVGAKFNTSEKFEIRMRTGVSYWRLLGKSGGKIDPTSLLVQDLNTLKNYRNNNIGVVFYSGIYYKLNPQWSIMAEPSGSLSLTNLTMNAPVETRPYQYGLNIGVQYKLK
jgi:hypothetical protein